MAPLPVGLMQRGNKMSKYFIGALQEMAEGKKKKKKKKKLLTPE